MIGKHGFFSQQQGKSVEPITPHVVHDIVIKPVSALTEKVSKLNSFRPSDVVSEAHQVLGDLKSALKAQLSPLPHDDSIESERPKESTVFKARN